MLGKDEFQKRVDVLSDGRITCDMQITDRWRRHVGVPAPYELVEAAGAGVAVKRTGRGDPVLCLSATGHGGRDFILFAESVADHGFEVVAVDWPGHGSSPDAPTALPVSATSYAKLVSELIPKLWPAGERPIIIGNSIGGAAAIEVAAQNPQQVRALVVSNAGGLAPLDRLARFVIGRMVAFFRAGEHGAPWFPRAFGLYYRLILRGRPAAAQRRRIAAASAELAPLLAQAWDSFRQTEADIRGLVRQLQCPVLWAWARNDQVVAWRRSRSAALTAPDHRVRLFRGGHSPFLEDPDAFADAFRAFAASLKETTA